jgi:hypothetical protein
MTRPAASDIVINTFFLWAATAVAAVAFWPIYRSPQLILVLVVATLIGSAIAILGAVFRWLAPVVLGATIVAFLLFGVQLAVPAKTTSFGLLPTIDGLRDLVAGVALGWKQLLTISLPVGQYESLLVPIWTVVLLLTVIALSIALRARWGSIAVLGPVILFLVGIAFGPTYSIQPVLLSLTLLVVVILWIIWRRWYRRRTAIRLLARQVRDGGANRGELGADTRFVGVRTLLSAAVILALASGTAIAAAYALPPTGEREVLRTTTQQPFEPRNYVSPLSGFRNYWESPDTESVMLSIRGLPKGSRVRIATLDTYDGVVYSVGSATVDSASGSFTRVPYEFDQRDVTGKRVSLTVEVQDYAGVWLPTVGKLEKVTFTGKDSSALRDSFFYNDTTGTAADVAGARAGESYRLTAVVPTQPSLAELAKVDAGSATVPSLGALPASLSSTLNSYVSGAAGQGQKLVAMIEALKKTGYVSHGVGKEVASRSGHAADRINELLTDQRMIGDAEQYSVTAALMARELGFPARVVMGFVPETTGAGASEIRGRDISAWIEVDTSQYGWVTIDPNPPVRPIPAAHPKDPNQVARPQTIVPPPATQADPPDAQNVPDTQQHDAAPLNVFLEVLVQVLIVLAWVILGLAILLSPFLVIIASKVRRRRRRRRAATSLEQIAGGWREFQDRVLDHGIDAPSAATRSEVATSVGGAQSLVLAAVADRATFAPGQPDTAEADLVWRSVSELTAALDKGKTRWERIKARISLRSVRARRVGNTSDKR